VFLRPRPLERQPPLVVVVVVVVVSVHYTIDPSLVDVDLPVLFRLAMVSLQRSS
jgi:hypothetical protein